MIVFGSFLRNPATANDIDMIVPEFTDERMYEAPVSLEPYEQIAHHQGKPIDLFFTAYESQFNLAGWFDPKNGKWLFRMAFCGRDFFVVPHRRAADPRCMKLW
jgi:hypothetical protein